MYLRLYHLVIIRIALIHPLWIFAQSRPDTTSIESQGDFMFLADTLAARHAGREQPLSETSSDRSTKGFLRYERTLTPLNHFGANVFQPFSDDQILRNIIRTGKDNPAWNPLFPEVVDDYHYDGSGTTKNFTLRSSMPDSGTIAFRPRA